MEIVYWFEQSKLKGCVAAQWKSKTFYYLGTSPWFIDSSKASSKAVLLHNGNQKPSNPLVQGLKETYDTLQLILSLVKYSSYNWNICGDLKVIGLLLGLQMGYIRHQCFLCLWDSRDDDEQYYVKKDWPSRENFLPGRFTVLHIPLVDSKKIYLPPMHIKLGLFKNFVKALDQSGNGFKHLQQQFPTKTDAKLKSGIFIGPAICKLMNDESCGGNSYCSGKWCMKSILLGGQKVFGQQ